MPRRRAPVWRATRHRCASGPRWFARETSTKRLGGGTTNVAGNDDRSRTYNLDLGCGVKRQCKFVVKNDGDTKTIYKPNTAPNSGYTTSTNLTVTIDF